MLTTGSRVPDTEFTDTDGHVRRLYDGECTRGTVVYFMRATSCALANRQVDLLVSHHDDYDSAGIGVVVAVPEDRTTAAAWKSERGITFPVLCDPDAAVHASIGLRRKVFGSWQQSGTILVDSTGIVRHACGANLPNNSYDRAGIDAAIRVIVDRAERQG